MPRFIIERSNFAALEAVLGQERGIKLARTFRLRGKVFDVYIAPDRVAFDCIIRRPYLLGVGSAD